MDYILLIVAFILGFISVWIVLVKKFQSDRNAIQIQAEKDLNEQLQNSQMEMSKQVRDKDIEITQLRTELHNLNKLNAKLDDSLGHNRVLLEENASLRTRITEAEKTMKEKLQLLTETKDTMKKDFELLANKIFEEKNSKFKETSTESLNNILNPVRSQLNEFKKRVEDVYDNENKDRASLKTEIENLRKLNETLNQEAMNLTKALTTDNKKQGNWGEMKLERILEDSGLTKDLEYFPQQNFKDGSYNDKRPDIIVKLPDNKDIVIDAKMSLKAYFDMVSSEDPTEREQFLKAHLLSVRNQVKNLASKKYEDLADVNTISHVLMFIPVESAYLTALEADNTLFLDAMKMNIMIVGPGTLMYVLRTIKQIWNSENQTKNSRKIAEEAGKMLDKFEGFLTDMEKIEANINTLNKSYTEAKKKLSSGNGNLVRKAKQLQELGVKMKKDLTLNKLNEHNE